MFCLFLTRDAWENTVKTYGRESQETMKPAVKTLNHQLYIMPSRITIRSPRYTVNSPHPTPLSTTLSFAKLPSKSSTLRKSRILSPSPTYMSLPTARTSTEATDRRHLDLSAFVVDRVIGTGSFARVKLARYKETSEVVVLKIMSKADILRKKQVEHVHNERTLLSTLASPFIVTLKSAFQDRENLYLVEEFVQGGELYSLIRHKRHLTAAEANFYSAEIVAAFSYLHSRHVLYRDLKPENVLLTSSGHIKLSDFGFAKCLSSSEKTYTLCGTPEYLAPEVIRLEGHSYSYDWWCLGVLLYEMIVGKAPFLHRNPYKLYEMILTKEIAFPLNMDAKAKDLIEKLTRKEQKERLNETQILAHPFYRSINWSVARQCALSPPFSKDVLSDFDSHHFDQYPDDRVRLSDRRAVAEDLFKSFN